MKRPLAVLSLVVLTLSAAAAPRRRATLPPRVSDATPAGWLTNHAYRLETTQPGAPLRDLEPLRAILGNAAVVGLGDGTHGTHEYFELKLRMIEFLVREMGFTAVAMEAPFADWTQLNDYVLGGPGDPRTILVQNRKLGYFFWANEEVVALANWMREYNATRGDRPPVQIAGMDIFDLDGARTLVTQYLERADPAKAPAVRTVYTRCTARPSPDPVADCAAQTEAIRADIAAREGELIGRSSAREFLYALHAATLVGADFEVSNSGGLLAHRDEAMADFAEFIRAHQTTGKLVIWAHQEHLSKSDRQVDPAKSTAQFLAERLGDDFFVIGNASAEGTFNALMVDRRTNTTSMHVFELPSIGDDSYETAFRSAAIPLLLIPLRGTTLPDWLTSPRRLHGGTAVGPYDFVEELAKKFDAVMYVDRTTPTRSFW
ncbi:MAG TPA: erythromycin esterase family protein [Thermoanaerobaculia bacterium]|nr:erythromycin esterase family protein [Thermoanaerobaculia bacterium]